MEEQQNGQNEMQEIRDALNRARTTSQLALIGLVFALGLLAADLAQPRSSRVNLRGHLVISPRPPRRADLQGVELRQTRLNGANLQSADLSNATLTDVNLSGADLSGAILRGARLQGVDLSHASLTGADLTDTVYDIETVWPEGFDAEKNGAVLAESADRGR